MLMTIRLAFLNICFLVLINCGKNKTENGSVEAKNANQEVKITARAIDNFDYSDYALSNDAEVSVADWEKYQELAIQISYLKKADLSFFNGDNELLKKFLDALKISVPKDLKTNPVTSRITILETTILRLNDNLTLDNIPGKDKLDGIEEVIVAFSNLNYQINKKLERDKYSKIEPK